MTLPPDGYRLLKAEEQLQPGDLVRHVDGSWHEPYAMHLGMEAGHFGGVSRRAQPGAAE